MLRKIIIFILALMTLMLSVSACKTQSEFTLEEALLVYQSKERDYTKCSFPIEYTQEELDECMKNAETAKAINSILDKNTDERDMASDLEFINYAISMDYVFRPVALNKFDVFKERLKLLIDVYDNSCMTKEDLMAFNQKHGFDVLSTREYYGYFAPNMPSEEQVKEATKVIDECSPKYPEVKQENVFLHLKWGWMQNLVVELESAIGKSDRANYIAEHDTWAQDLLAQQKADD